MFRPFACSILILRIQYSRTTPANPVSIASVGAFLPHTLHELPLAYIPPNLEYPHAFLQGTPWGAPSSQGVLPNTPLGIPDPSSRALQIAAVWSAPTPLPPPPQAPTFIPSNWRRIPQRVYSYGRRQWDFAPSESVYFGIGGYPGFNMEDALQERFTGLDFRDEPVLMDARGAISFRFLVRVSW